MSSSIAMKPMSCVVTPELKHIPGAKKPMTLVREAMHDGANTIRKVEFVARASFQEISKFLAYPRET